MSARKKDDKSHHVDDEGSELEEGHDQTISPGNGKTTGFVLTKESQELENLVLEALERGERQYGRDKKYVVCQFFINRIFKVDDVDQRVELDFYLKLNWKSDKYKGTSDEFFQADETRFEDDWWEPGVEVTNGIELNKMIEKEESFWLEFPEHGVLAYTQRYIGSISAQMHLQDFPFDRQIITLTFESFHWKAEDMILLRLERDSAQTRLECGSWRTMNSAVSLPEWNVEAIDTIEKTNYYAFEDRTYAQVCVNIHLLRLYLYYVKKVIFMVLLIVLMSASVFFMEASSLPERTSITVTLFLAAIAFNFVVGSTLPRVSYDTTLDQYLLVSYLAIVATLIQNVIVYWTSLYLGAETAFLVDMLSLSIFCLAYFGYTYKYIQDAINKQHKKPGQPESKKEEEAGSVASKNSKAKKKRRKSVKAKPE